MAMNTTFALTNASRVCPEESPILTNVSSVDEFNGESLKENDAILKFISGTLMDDDLESEASMLYQHSTALQATEKSLYDALGNHSSDSTSFIEQPSQSLVITESAAEASSGANSNTHFHTLSINDQFLGQNDRHTPRQEPSPITSGVKENRYREEDDLTEHNYRSIKQSANNINNDCQPELLEEHDDLMLFPNSGQRRSKPRNKSLPKKQSSNEGGEHKQNVTDEFIDLSSVLMQCAKAVVRFNNEKVMGLMFQIRKHSSPQGNSLQRVAHYFAYALEARLASNGSSLQTSFNCNRVSCPGILKTYKMFITSCPFLTMSNLFAKSTIMKLADGVARVHIIDFGISHGFQWPSLIQALSERLGGAPKLRITGIEHPQPGFRPMDRVSHAGRQLARYCERFKVPFDYNAIAKEWNTITLEDLKIEKGELVVVNSMYRLHNLIDRDVGSPRDAVLKLIRKINPNVFVHGVVNGTHSSPFFVTRFKEAFFHYLAMFDMLDATVPRDEEDQRTRVGYEGYILGKEVVNIIACEGTDRVENPETYQQWRFRTKRMGFRQLPLDGEVVRRVRKVKSSYHRDFSVSEDDNWVLLDWKGRVIHAISCWQPAVS